MTKTLMMSLEQNLEGPKTLWPVDQVSSLSFRVLTELVLIMFIFQHEITARYFLNKTKDETIQAAVPSVAITSSELNTRCSLMSLNIYF